ncbi:hepatitis A virus cellular receptor 1 homolog [Antrostomus carolinensis]|uniref:hepatitis A virus cellular receptor 1 homolog n=1 Tax=Antrostomus carolinensis TaxID=279965 RepID=UPI0010A98CC1|nr:hepatitis A virus cellular receptor 1 homolog [Antrostomus carolinensis]
MSHFVLFQWITIQIFIAHTSSDAVIRGVIGQPVRLPCFYQVPQHKGVYDMCWGRGPCPNSKCNNNILHTTGNRVTFRKSQRYNLQGYISYGDVSLTIGKVKAEDAGTYCCRVEIPGWFNDIKRNMRLEVVRAPPVRTTTTRKAPISPKHFRKTTFAPQATSDHQATEETAVLLTTTIPPATTATSESPAVVTLETIAASTFAVTANDTFPDTMVTTSALTDFSTGFQAADMRTEDDDEFCSADSVPFLGDTKVTIEFPSTLPTAMETKSSDTSLMVEDLPTTATTPPVPTTLQTLTRTFAPSVISGSADGKAEEHDGNKHKWIEPKPVTIPSELDTSEKPHPPDSPFPSYAILIACLIVVPVLVILMLSLLFWKRKHTKKFIIKR